MKGVKIGVFVVWVLILGWSVNQRRVTAQTPEPAPASVPVVAGPQTPVVPGVPPPSLEVHSTPSPAAPANWPDQAIWALIMSYGLQALKNCKWFPFLQQTTEKNVQAAWGLGLAVVTAAGIHISTSGAFIGDSSGTITITGVSLSVLKNVAFQWASQQGWYDLVVNKRGDPAPAKVG